MSSGQLPPRTRPVSVAPGRLTVEARRAIFAEMLGRHAKPDSVRQEVAVPGWTQDLVDEITDAYEEDVALIAALPGVEFLSP